MSLAPSRLASQAEMADLAAQVHATRYAACGGSPMELGELAIERALGWLPASTPLEAVEPDGTRRQLTYAEMTVLQALECGVRG